MREEESHTQGIKRQLVDVTGKKSAKKANINILKIRYLSESIKINFNKKYPLTITSRIWLATNTIIFGFMAVFVRPTVNTAIKKFLPVRVYSKLIDILG